jgi:hypothetical protein
LCPDAAVGTSANRAKKREPDRIGLKPRRKQSPVSGPVVSFGGLKQAPAPKAAG